MPDDINKFTELFNSELLGKIPYIPIKDDELDTPQFFANHINNRLYNDYFGFVEKYRHNYEFYELLIQSIHDLSDLKLVLPDDYYRDILDYISKKDNDFLISHLSIVDESDLDYCLSLGYSLKDVLEKSYNISANMLLTIYLRDKSLLSDILSNHLTSASNIVAYEFINGNTAILEDYFNRSKYFLDIRFLLKEIVDNCNSFNINALLDNMILYYFDNSMISQNVSVVTDNDLVKDLITKGGSRALVLAKNPTSELVSLAKDFSYDDYVFIEGDYKKSETLLLNLLNKGYSDALFKAPLEAIGEGVFDYLVKNNIDIELLKDNEVLKQSYAINKYLALHGYYANVDNINHIFSDINAFNFALEMIKEGKFTAAKNKEIEFLEHIVNKEYEKVSRLSYYTSFSKEVGEALIKMGFTCDDYIKYFDDDFMLTLCFLEHGDYEVLFKDDTLDYSFAPYLDKITYEMYLQYMEKYGVSVIPFEIFSKFFKEGHHDIFLKAKIKDSYVSDYVLKDLGLADLSYEEYLKLPDYVRNFPLLKNKYLSYSDNIYLEVLKDNPTSEALEQAALRNMPFEELETYLFGRSYLITLPVIMHYLDEKHLEIFKYVRTSFDFPQIDLVVDKILALVDGKVPPEYVMECKKINDAITERFIKAKDFSILDNISYFDHNTLKLLIDNGYTLDDFIKKPFYNWQVICHFLTKENEEVLVDCLEKINNGGNYHYVSDSYEIILKAYQEGYSISNINKLIKIFNVNAFELYKHIKEEDYAIFNELEINGLFYSKLLVTNILPYLSPEKIISNFDYYVSSDMKNFIIEKMVNLGHSEFIDYFDKVISKDTLKKALLAGYFPSDEVLSKNSNLKKAIKNLDFTEEELNYLKVKMDKQPLFVIYFTDILQNLDLLYSYVMKEPRILLYCDEKIACNPYLLRKVVVTNPFIVGQLVNNLSHDFIMELAKINNEFLDYVPISIFSKEELISLVKIYPNYVDQMTKDIDEVFAEAFNSGYKFSFNSSLHSLDYAFKLNILVPKEIILRFDYNDIFDLLFSNVNFYNNNSGYVKDILDTLKNKDEDEFLWQLFSYISCRSFINNPVLKQINDEYHIKADELGRIDSKERYLLNLILLDIMNLSDEQYKRKIEEILDKTSLKEDVIASVCNNNRPDLASVYAKKYFLSNPIGLIKYVDDLDDEFVKTLKGIILDYPDLLSFGIVKQIANKIIDNKEMVLKLFALGYFNIFDNLKGELRNDYDILVQYVKVVPRYIIYMDKNDYYRELCLEGLIINPNLYLEINDEEILKDEEILRKVLPFCASAFCKADSSLQTIENFRLIKGFKDFQLSNVEVSLFTKMVEFNLFDINQEDLNKTILNYLFEHQSELNRVVFKNNYIIQLFIKEIKNDFKKVIALFDYFDSNDLPAEICEVSKNTKEIINGANKVNLLEDTSLLSYDLVRYIYPLMGLSATLDLLKYNSTATNEISKAIKDGRSNDILKYWEFVKNFKLFPDNERLIHFAFMNYDSFSTLIKDVLVHQNELNENDLANLRRIIVNKNSYCIKDFNELKNYEVTVDKHVNDILNRNSIVELKNSLAILFGFYNFDMMESTFNNFQFNNFAKLNYVYGDIKKKYGNEYLGSIKLKAKDIKLIVLMEKIIESDNVVEIKELFENLFISNQKIIDYSDMMDELISKFRRIYNAQFNTRLTDINNIKSQRMNFDDPNNKYGVTIIKMDGEPFNFLAHRLYNYDASMKTAQKSFSELLMDDPSLWTKLDGASTLSTSSFSDKGFWFLHSDYPSGLVYLFNKLPEDFLLFMYGRDLYVQHGGHNLKPTSNRNLFTDIDSLNQSSCYAQASYNEVAGYRKGMLPCAFACVGDAPNMETVKAAKYFKETLGVDIPIIMFDKLAYDNKKTDDYDKAVEQYKIDSSYEALLGIFYDGIAMADRKSKILADKIDLCLTSLKEQYYKGKISLYDLLRKVQELENVANRIFAGNSECAKEMRKLQIFKKALCALKRISKDEVIRLEAANLGESGIMYKFVSEGQTYLVKPAVDKEHYQEQSFRSDIQVAASKLQKLLSPETSVEVQKVNSSKLALSKQEYLDINQEETAKLNEWAVNGGPIKQKYLDQLLREYVLDFVICNFDAFSGNFVVDANGNIRGIDKEQAFRFIDDGESLKPDFSYVPNGNSRIPIYKILFERYKKKEINLNLEIISDTLEELKGISDDDYLQIFKEYATALGKENAHVLLEKILNRKHLATEKIEAFLQELGYQREMDGVEL